MLEEKIGKLTEAINAQTAALKAQTAALSGLPAGTLAPEPDPKPKPKAGRAPKSKGEPRVNEGKDASVRDDAFEELASLGRQQAVDVLSRFGVKKFTALPPEKYSELLAACEKVKEGGAA